MPNELTRRTFLAAASALSTPLRWPMAEPTHGAAPVTSDTVAVPDDGWTMWLDTHAEWKDDRIFLPDQVRLPELPLHPPTEGWSALYARRSGEHTRSVALPTTVEQYFWGALGQRPYTPDEYRYAADDAIPQNGAYVGVSWFWREIEIPSSMAGKRILLEIRGARMRAEVFLNEALVGYSIMEELPFTCDLTTAAKPGGTNRLAIRITNPGGRYDWVDGGTIRWGTVNVFRSHGFGGLDRGLALRVVPKGGHISDLWVLNTPNVRTITANATIEGAQDGPARFEVIDPRTGLVAVATKALPPSEAASHTLTESLHLPGAELWELANPKLYILRATLYSGDQTHVREVLFGFRWFAPQGLGSNALFRLNGRRIKLYTAISWGFWGHNGLFPTPQLAEREVTQAKRLGLNCLNFHRNVGKHEVFDAHDRLGLLRYMEPGGGKLSIGKTPAGVALNAANIVMEPAHDEADQFSRDFMLEKCRHMVRAFRSHPSLIQYTLQNELGADLKNPATFAAIDLMHAEDPSRSVVLNDGFSPPPRSAPQAWYAPYNDKMHRSDEELWGGWWNNHQGAGDQWYDRFYKSPEDFTYRQPLRDVLVEFGEMEGCAVADNHPLMVRQIKASAFGGNGSSYDLHDHEEIAAAYEAYFTRWGFRHAFPSMEAFFTALGNKCYESWQQYMENARICDEVDFAAISGWESTAIENHSGIVDNLRNFKGDPDLIASSLTPIRPVLKQRRLCVAAGESAIFDVFLLNDTGTMPTGKMHLDVVHPDRSTSSLSAWPIPQAKPDQFSYAVAVAYATPALTQPGIHQFRLAIDGVPLATSKREIWVIERKAPELRPLRIGVSGLTPALKQQLERASDLHIAPFAAGETFDVIIASGVKPGSLLDRAIGDETGLEAQPAANAPKPKQVPGELPPEVLAAVQAGTPLLAVVPDDALADGVARQLAALGAFTYSGQVGDTRAPWMGNWLFVREHPTFAGMPADRVCGVHYQAEGKLANGLLIDTAPGRPAPEVIMAYSRDHDRRLGAASFTCRVGNTPVLVHRAPPFNAPLQERWLRNTLALLTAN